MPSTPGIGSSLLSAEEIQALRDVLAAAKNPLFLYDGDGDGLTAFLLLYHIHREGRGVGLTASKNLDDVGLRKVQELNPDVIFILDVPAVSQEFIDAVQRPVYWIDHHAPLQRRNVKYYNPRLKDPLAYVPTSRMAWDVSQREEDLWIATAGSLADFSVPDFLDQFIARHPQFLDEPLDISTMLFRKPIGHLVKLFFFLQKGPTGEVRKSLQILSRITAPEDIFFTETSAGKYLHKRFKEINSRYEILLEQAKKEVSRSRFVLFFYQEDAWSFTTNLANELSGLYPQKYIIIARRKSGEVKCSLRGKGVINPLNIVLNKVAGRGGGHPDACGAVIPQASWEEFIQQFKEEVKKM